MIRLCQALGLLSVLIFDGVELVNSEEPVNVTLNKNNPFPAARDATYTCGQNAMVRCHIKNDAAGGKYVKLVLYTQSPPKTLDKKGTGNDQYSYFDLEAGVESSGLYSCQHSNKEYLISKSHTFNITIIVQGSGSTCTSNTPTTTSTTRPTAATTSPTASNHDHHYGALNILIYTVIAGVFLGVLMLVSIITCWVRSRKNNRLRSLLPQDAPQDYLDYIQQGQFTPLTTSELIASMRERPPTYNESEVIQRRMNDTSHDDTPPPPLPPRNPSPRGSSPEEEQRNEEVNQREPLGNLDTTEGQIDHQAPLIDIDTMLFDFPLPPRDDFTLSLLLPESNESQQPHPPNQAEVEETTENLIPTFVSTNQLVGVIPSINNAVV